MLQVQMSPNFKQLSSDDNLPPELHGFDKTPQRTGPWWKRRRHKASGSKLANFFFIDNAKDLAEYREIVFGNRPRPALDAEAQKRVQWGVDHEDDACATAMHHIPSLRIWDIGFEIHRVHKWFGSSPDGIVYWPDQFPNSPWGVVEIKCCTKKNKKGVSIPHPGVPSYYIPQLHAEMACVPLPKRCDWCLFISWSASTTRIYVVNFNEEYWNGLWDLITDFKAGDIPFEHWQRKCARVKQNNDEIARSAKLVCVVQSCCLQK